jgi:hypothetical protein
MGAFAYPMSEEEEEREEDRPFAASATPHEPEITGTGLTQRRTCKCFEHTNDGGALDVPDAARTITWNDPFYENNPEIVAAFDIDSNKLGEIYEWRGLCAWCLLLLLVGFFIPVTSTSGSAYWWFLWVPVPGSIFVIVHAYKEKYKVERRHVAVARRGVYLDETDEPGSSSLAKRTVLKFDSIASCRVHDMGYCAAAHYSVVIVTRNTNKPTTTSAKVVPEHNSHNVTGLLNGQAFVDLVSAMMEWSKEPSSNTGPSPVDTVQDTTSAEMV